MNIKDTINNVNKVFVKLPFKGFAEKIPAEKRAKVPVLEKLIPWANQIVCGLAVVMIIIIIAAASGGGGPKALAREAYKLAQQSKSVGSNPAKAAALLRKGEKLQAKVEKLPGDKQQIYLAEVSRLFGGNAVNLPGVDFSDF